MATYLTDTYIRHQSSINEASNPASRYIKYNRLLQQCLWPITFNKTCFSKVNKLACRIAGMIMAMVQSEQVLEHDFVQVLPFIWSLQRIYLNGCIHQGLWLWWYGFSAHLLVCYVMCLWYSLSIRLFSFNMQDVYGKLFFFKHFSHYRPVSNIRRTLVGNEIVDHSDVVGASPVGAAPTTSSFST